MIFVNRGSVIPSILTKSGEIERNKALVHFSKRGARKKFDYKVYQHKSVKELLVQIFKMKCAYCESPFLAVYPGDVEHFRPKGPVIERVWNKKTKKYTNRTISQNGYYWLGAEWDNLLLSCKLCNQEQTHELPNNQIMVLGKKNQFPLKEGYERKRLKKPEVSRIREQVEEEDRLRLIIDPCKDRAEEYFGYLPDSGFIVARSADEEVTLVAETSIRVYALQRMPLVHARKELLIDIQAQQQRILELAGQLSKIMGRKSDEAITYTLFLEKRLLAELNFLQDRYLRPEQPYLGMARYFISNFMKEHFNIDLHERG